MAETAGVIITVHDYLWYYDVFIVSWPEGSGRKHKISTGTMATVMGDNTLRKDHHKRWKLVRASHLVPDWFIEPKVIPRDLVDTGKELLEVY